MFDSVVNNRPEFIAKLFKGECLDVMKDIPDQSVDMILADLPYGTTMNKWDTTIPLDDLWKEYYRVTKENAAIVLFAQSPFDKVLGMSNIKNLRYEWIWEKNVATGFINANRMPLKAHENILVFYKKEHDYYPQFSAGKPYKSKRNGRIDTGENYGRVNIPKRTDTLNDGKRYPRSVIKFDRETGKHPTQKPVPLLEYLIKTYTTEGETVLDNTMGSGSTGVAAKNTGRNFIGIEKEQGYFDLAKLRIDCA